VQHVSAHVIRIHVMLWLQDPYRSLIYPLRGIKAITGTKATQIAAILREAPFGKFISVAQVNKKKWSYCLPSFLLLLFIL